MGETTVALRRADADSLSYVEALLAENDLPARDVRSKPTRFYVGYDGSDPVGVGGIEAYGPDGLLRSVAVERSVRGDGFGGALCDALEEEARSEGVETLYLLTTTASAFFADRGFAAIERTDAPAAIRRTSEFDHLCPATATCMRKPL